MAKFRSKPVEIEAIQWTGGNIVEIVEFSNGEVGAIESPDKLCIHTLDSIAYADPGDWLVKGTKGEFYPCREDIFEEKYILVP